MIKITQDVYKRQIKQYVKLFEMDGVKLEFQPEVFEYIVDKAIEYKLGACLLYTSRCV